MALAIVNQDKTEVTITVKDKDLVEFCIQHPDFNFKDILRSIPKTFANSAPASTKTDSKSLTKNVENIQNQITKMATDINNLKTNNEKQLNDLKNDYIGAIKCTLDVNNYEKIIPNLKELHENFSNKLFYMLSCNPNETEKINNALKLLENNIINSVSQNDINKNIQVLTENVQNMISKFTTNGSHEIGKMSETILQNLLEETFINAEIVDKTDSSHAGDYWLIRKDKPKILIENKNYKNKVYINEVDKFISDIKNNNMAGIMISQKSSIVHRNNFEFEIIGDNVVVFLTEMDYDMDKLKTAVDIIDNIQKRIEKSSGDIHIDRITLEKINKAYQMFHYKKQEQLSILKQSFEACAKSIEDFDFDVIYDLLTQNGIQTNVKKWVCDNCDRVYPTEKGLKTHYRSCIEKNNISLECTDCGEVCKTQKGLKGHLKRVHNIE